ncbi:MAG: SapC family protein [Lamprobacter sp.]|uniref:SapC family protein n=1 Tax=Lamprobacter sp. TaxID=3100796 RepID=UPI002B259DAF|nr:SapC family protein [Lamprobacter sp.]MEA3638310.1 SapC family protein [Lamprobacter sp.]
MSDSPSHWVPLNADTHAQLAVRHARDYRFAAERQRVPISASELARAAQLAPIAFVADNAQWSAALLLGLDARQNLFVDPASGRWLADYIPADLRAHPFSLRAAKAEQATLYVLEADPHLVDARTTDPQQAARLFDDQGQPTAALTSLLDFFKAQYGSKQQLQRQLAALDERGLLVPWELRVERVGQAPAVRLTGLHKVDEATVNALDDSAYLELRALGVLPLLHAHWLSLGLVRRLRQLDLLRTTPDPSTAPALEPFLENDDSGLIFDFGDTPKH